MQVVEFDHFLPSVKQSPQSVAYALDRLADALIQVAAAYHAAGADWITIHEMGGSPAVLGPRNFEELVLPPLRRLVQAIPSPRILSICGNTNQVMGLMESTGAEALHIDQTNDLARSRQLLRPETLLFGNLDPVRVIAHGNPDMIRTAVQHAARAGADAVMPGCDLYLQTPAGNLRALARALRELNPL
jgi:[methyl-Co(III) methanol-specific corrinoid protein]:coenzyme M methyltransferase